MLKINMESYFVSEGILLTWVQCCFNPVLHYSNGLTSKMSFDTIVEIAELNSTENKSKSDKLPEHVRLLT